jgi:hypothetical protein
MIIVAFRPEHLTMLDLQEAQAELTAIIAEPGYGEALAATGHAFTAMDGNNKVLCCGGLVEVWAERAMIWALLSKGAGPYLRRIHRAADGYLKQARWRRIEAYVASDFKPGRQWIEMLGFTHEGTMRAFSPAGGDHELYARVR